jgi:hypothetical protein
MGGGLCRGGEPAGRRRAWRGERGGGGGGGRPPPPGKMMGGRGRPCTDRKTEKWRNPRYNNGGGSPRRQPSPEPSINLSIGDEPSVGSTNQRHRDEALDETNAAVPSDSTNNAWIESNCSPELEPFQTSTSNSRSFGSNLRVGF